MTAPTGKQQILKQSGKIPKTLATLLEDLLFPRSGRRLKSCHFAPTTGVFGEQSRGRAGRKTADPKAKWQRFWEPCHFGLGSGGGKGRE